MPIAEGLHILMLMDCYTHVFPSQGEHLLQELARAGVSHALVMIIPSNMTMTGAGEYVLDINDTTLARIADDNCRLGNWAKGVGPHLFPFAWLDYRMQGTASFFEELVTRYHFKGLKIHQVFNGPADERYFELVDKAVALQVPVTIHTGFRAPARVENIGTLAARFPQGRFICSHLLEEFGLNAKSDYLRLADHYDNVWFECSYVRHPRKLQEFAQAIGAHRILFGSDFPFGARDIEWDLTKVGWAAIGSDEREKILWENAAALFGL